MPKTNSLVPLMNYPPASRKFRVEESRGGGGGG